MGHRPYRVAGLSNHGFTLAELLVVMAIIGVVLGAIYGVFTSSDRSYRTQDRVANAQQSVRVGIDFMVRDIRMAGLDPYRTAGAGIEEASGTKIRITADISDVPIGSSDEPGPPDGDTDDKFERITYEFYVDPDDPNKRQLRRCLYEGTGSQNWQPLIDNVSALSFTYLDANGNDLVDPADPSKIRTVEISMTVQEKDARQQPFTRTLTTRVSCRNLGL
jgi:type IV pilus assembly protein PilW